MTAPPARTYVQKPLSDACDTLIQVGPKRQGGQMRGSLMDVATEVPVAHDARVEEVQWWLNDTFGWMDGWEYVPVTGRTGWSTVYGLTRALQATLGITALSNNFGAGTMSALTTQYGEVSATSAGADKATVIRIIQAGLYCKGYNPNGFDGVFGVGCAAAIRALKIDMGYPTTTQGTVPPKVFKGLLTMDPYALAPAGSAAARSAQQWMNMKYLSRADFFIMPCDGLYSRTVQKYLVYALQYEMNVSGANGNFGSGTRSALQAQGNFGVGATDSTKNFVRLFHAALIFNQYTVAFDSVFSPSDSATVSAFQSFSKLDVNGSADYRTWCSLLVSNGDPTRPGAACDTRVTITPAFATVLTAAGYETVGRYLSNAPVANPLDKKIKPGELATIFGAGLTAFPIFQEIGSSAANFSHSHGTYSGHKADEAARRNGVPAGTTIYFAVDFDPTDDEITRVIVPHFRGVNDSLRANGSRYKVGAYGTRNVCQTLTQKSLITYSFVAGMSTGFSGNLGYGLPSNWAFDQIQEYQAAVGLPLDKNVKSGRDAGFSTIDAASALPAELTFLAWVEAKAAEFVADNADTHAWDSNSRGRLVCQFLRRNDYNDIGFTVILSSMTPGWIEFVEGKMQEAGVQEIFSYLDASGIRMDFAHLAAACEGYLDSLPVDNPNRSDLAGWAGDLLSMMNFWKFASGRAINNIPSIVALAESTIGVQTPDLPDLLTRNYFSLTDLCQDVDGYSIGKRWSDPSTQSFSQLMMETVRQGGPSAAQNRFDYFFQERFGGSENKLRDVVRTCLSVGSPHDPLYGSLSNALSWAIDPGLTPLERPGTSDLEGLAEVFVQKILSLA